MDPFSGFNNYNLSPYNNIWTESLLDNNPFEDFNEPSPTSENSSRVEERELNNLGPSTNVNMSENDLNFYHSNSENNSWMTTNQPINNLNNDNQLPVMHSQETLSSLNSTLVLTNLSLNLISNNPFSLVTKQTEEKSTKKAEVQKFENNQKMATEDLEANVDRLKKELVGLYSRYHPDFADTLNLIQSLDSELQSIMNATRATDDRSKTRAEFLTTVCHLLKPQQEQKWKRYYRQVCKAKQIRYQNALNQQIQFLQNKMANMNLIDPAKQGDALFLPFSNIQSSSIILPRRKRNQFTQNNTETIGASPQKKSKITSTDQNVTDKQNKIKNKLAPQQLRAKQVEKINTLEERVTKLKSHVIKLYNQHSPNIWPSASQLLDSELQPFMNEIAEFQTCNPLEEAEFLKTLDNLPKEEKKAKIKTFKNKKYKQKERISKQQYISSLKKQKYFLQDKLVEIGSKQIAELEKQNMFLQTENNRLRQENAMLWTGKQI